MATLCDGCAMAGTSCPVWPLTTTNCVEFRPRVRAGGETMCQWDGSRAAVTVARFAFGGELDDFAWAWRSRKRPLAWLRGLAMIHRWSRGALAARGVR